MENLLLVLLIFLGVGVLIRIMQLERRNGKGALHKRLFIKISEIVTIEYDVSDVSKEEDTIIVPDELSKKEEGLAPKHEDL